MIERTLTLVRDEDIDRELERLAHETGHSTPEIALEALIEWLEDREDVREALEILGRNEPVSSSDEVRKRLGLAR